MFITEVEDKIKYKQIDIGTTERVYIQGDYTRTLVIEVDNEGADYIKAIIKELKETGEITIPYFRTKKLDNPS